MGDDLNVDLNAMLYDMLNFSLSQSAHRTSYFRKQIMSSVKWSLCVCYSFLDREFVSRWSSATVLGGKNAAVQSLKHLWFSAKYPLFKVSREPQWKGCLLIVFTNMLTSCLNIQTLLSHKPCDSVWPPFFPPLNGFLFQ